MPPRSVLVLVVLVLAVLAMALLQLPHVLTHGKKLAGKLSHTPSSLYNWQDFPSASMALVGVSLHSAIAVGKA